MQDERCDVFPRNMSWDRGMTFCVRLLCMHASYESTHRHVLTNMSKHEYMHCKVFRTTKRRRQNLGHASGHSECIGAESTIHAVYAKCEEKKSGLFFFCFLTAMFHVSTELNKAGMSHS